MYGGVRVSWFPVTKDSRNPDTNEHERRRNQGGGKRAPHQLALFKRINPGERLGIVTDNSQIGVRRNRVTVE
jgi:hypothetical protein